MFCVVQEERWAQERKKKIWKREKKIPRSPEDDLSILGDPKDHQRLWKLQNHKIEDEMATREKCEITLERWKKIPTYSKIIPSSSAATALTISYEKLAHCDLVTLTSVVKVRPSSFRFCSADSSTSDMRNNFNKWVIITMR
jgi:hypothetical protein